MLLGPPDWTSALELCEEADTEAGVVEPEEAPVASACCCSEVAAMQGLGGFSSCPRRNHRGERFILNFIIYTCLFFLLVFDLPSSILFEVLLYKVHS